MDLNLNPIATQCCVTGRAFAEHDRVVCYLVREDNGLTGRRDLLESADSQLPPPALIYCRWVIGYKPRRRGVPPCGTARQVVPAPFARSNSSPRANPTEPAHRRFSGLRCAMS